MSARGTGSRDPDLLASNGKRGSLEDDDCDEFHPSLVIEHSTAMHWPPSHHFTKVLGEAHGRMIRDQSPSSAIRIMRTTDASSTATLLSRSTGRLDYLLVDQAPLGDMHIRPPLPPRRQVTIATAIPTTKDDYTTDQDNNHSSNSGISLLEEELAMPPTITVQLRGHTHPHQLSNSILDFLDADCDDFCILPPALPCRQVSTVHDHRANCSRSS